MNTFKIGTAGDLPKKNLFNCLTIFINTLATLLNQCLTDINKYKTSIFGHEFRFADYDNHYILRLISVILNHQWLKEKHGNDSRYDQKIMTTRKSLFHISL